MQRQSELVLVRLKSSQAVEASVTLNGAKVGRKLDERFVQFLAGREEGAPRPSSQDHLFILRDELAASRERLAPLDNQHVENIRKFLRKRDQRDRQAEIVYDQLGVSRRTIDDLFEPDSAFKVAGIQSPISRNPDRLIHQANLALERLNSPDLVLPKPKVTGIKVDPKTLVEDLEPEVGKLQASNTELHEARRAVQQSREDRNAALEEQYDTFLWASRTLEGYYRLAGEVKLAQEIRPSTRRPGRRAIEVEGGEESGESADSSGSDSVTPAQADDKAASTASSATSES